jgi:2-keto-4-pentenoate hydratase
MEADRAAAACALLRQHRAAGTLLAALPPEMAPAARDEGYAIQAWLDGPGATPPWGWKIAATSVAGQRHIGVDGPMAGRLLPEMVLAATAAVPLAGNAMRVAEPEFVFRMGADLPPRAGGYAVADVLAAVAGLHVGIEIPDSRFADFAAVGGPALIADNACAHHFILGPEAPPAWRDLDLAAHPVACTLNGGGLHAGLGANVLGDPRIALTWLANELAGLGITLRAGQYVTTGTCAVPLAIAPGDAVLADFGVLGQVAARFGA